MSDVWLRRNLFVGMPVTFPPQRRFILLGVAAAILLLFLALPTRKNYFQSAIPESSDKPNPGSFDADDFDPPFTHPAPVPGKKPVVDESVSTSHGNLGSGFAKLQRTDIETTTPPVLKSLDSDAKIGAYTWGFNVLDNLYLRNGTFYLVTSDKSRLPSKAEIMLKLHLETQDDEEDEGSQVRFINRLLTFPPPP